MQNQNLVIQAEQMLQHATQLHHAGQLDEADRIYQALIKQYPNHPAALHQRALVLHQKGDNVSAISMLRKALKLDAENARMWFNLGVMQQAEKQLSQALASYKQAIKIQPDYAMALSNMGRCQEQLGRVDQAKLSYQNAIEMDDQCSEAINNLAVIYKNEGLYALASEMYQQALAVNPKLASAWNNLGILSYRCGDVDVARDCFSKAMELKPGDRSFLSNFLMNSNYDDKLSVDELAKLHFSFQDYFSGMDVNDPKLIVKNKLHVGFVSPDFCRHPVAIFMLPLLRSLDRRAFEVSCFSTGANNDEVTKEIKKLSDNFLTIQQLNCSDACKLIQKNKVHILIDLAGHTSKNRLDIFAKRAAPLQITYLGYPNTTGLVNMDYRIVDHHTDPLGMSEPYVSETLLRFEHSFLNYNPITDSPEVSSLPCKDNGYITFGCFNNTAKISPTIIAVWARLAQKLPEAKFYLKSSVFNDEKTRKSFVDRFVDAGISAERVELDGYKEGYNDHLSQYNKVDIALDTFPYSGATTTCEALWMGVPVITLSGVDHRSRVSRSVLSNVGLSEFVADTETEFVDIAIALAGDIEKLSGVRCNLRSMMAASPLMDSQHFASEFAALLQKAWQDHAVKNQ